MSPALRMIHRFGVAAHRSHTKPAGRLSFLPLFAWKTAVQTVPGATLFDPQCCRGPATSAQLQVRAEQNRRLITPKRNLNPASALIGAV